MALLLVAPSRSEEFSSVTNIVGALRRQLEMEELTSEEMSTLDFCSSEPMKAGGRCFRVSDGNEATVSTSPRSARSGDETEEREDYAEMEARVRKMEASLRAATCL